MNLWINLMKKEFIMKNTENNFKSITARGDKFSKMNYDDVFVIF